jgi:hypothetical protein
VRDLAAIIEKLATFDILFSIMRTTNIQACAIRKGGLIDGPEAVTVPYNIRLPIFNFSFRNFCIVSGSSVYITEHINLF